MVLPVAFCLRSNFLAFCVAQTARIAISTIAAPKPISKVLRGLEARYIWDTSLSTIIQVVGLADLSAVGQGSIRLSQAIIALETAEAETESSDIDLDQPLDSVVLSKLGDSCHERCKFLLPAVVDPCDTLVCPLGQRDGDTTPGSQRRLGHSDPRVPAQAIG